jgi:tetratricopeptide (TPR) repeat protein
MTVTVEPRARPPRTSWPARRLVTALLAAMATTTALPRPAAVCLWDYDTIRDERRGLPGVAEVLAGKWERHSPFFYENRVARMTALVAKVPANWAAYDNLAVALEKLGRPAEAIAVMRRKAELNPGQYTTHANLGTFLLHTGQLDEGIGEIKRALAINPAAHFGREEYQLKLAEFLRDGQKDPRLLTAMNFLHVVGDRVVDPATYPPLTRPTTGPSTVPASQPQATQPATGPSASTAEEAEVERMIWVFRGLQPADLGLKSNVFDGLVGIIRFGTGTSAELYLTLGDLLTLRGDKNLAYLAYQRALDFKHPREAYLRAVMAAIKEHAYDKSALSDESIAADRAAADAWVRASQTYEDDLIRAGKDPDDEANLAGFYAANGPAVAPERFEVGDLLPRERAARAVLYIAVVLGALALAVLVAVVRWRRTRRRAAIGRPAQAGRP